MDDTEPDAPNLANDMYQSPAFRGAVQDDDFAWALCKLLVNSDFIQESSNRFWNSDGNAHSGEIIELLRGQRGGFRVYEDAEWYADTP
ncbi:MAG: hypothetical protein HOP09_15690 [Hyphomicrobium sp.]|nr:hypothetical protein [Hyphomicrobium sp.]